MARTAEAAADKKPIAGLLNAARSKKLDELAARTQRTRADIISTVVANWLDALTPEQIEEFGSMTRRMGLMPLDEDAEKSAL
jgi:hypothetical protein